jgi:hypothetical protein
MADEPLLTTAPIARQVAPTLCSRRGPDQDCSWYHGVWQYLRVFGLASAPVRHEDFFVGALGDLAETGKHPRVLVSGAADYATLAQVLRAYEGAPSRPDVTVLDRCGTPVLLSSWYGTFHGVPLHTVVADVLKYVPDAPFDVICTHSFLSQFSARTRPALVAQWREMLRPGGSVVTTTRISSPGMNGATRFTPEQAASFTDRVLQQARLVDGLPASPETMAEEARTYANRTVVHSVGSVDEVVGLFEDGGLRITRLDVHEISGNAAAAEWGPSTSRTAVHAEIVAVRD